MTFDQQRFGLASSFPGIDPRVWMTWGIVEAIKIDAAGAKADVLLWPDQRPETVAIGGLVGAGFGLHIPIEVGQWVAIAFARGDANVGGTIIGSLWDAGQVVPQRIRENPSDVGLFGPDGRSVRIVAQGLGKAILESTGSTVHLGLEAASLGVARITDTVTVTIPPGMVIIPNPLPPPDFIPNPIAITLSGVITSGSAKVKSS